MSGRGFGGSRPARKGEAVPPPEPGAAARLPGAKRPRRVSVTLDGETYVAFRTFVVERGISGEQALTEAVERMIGEGLR